MNGTPVGDQSGGLEPGSREVVPSTVTLRHNAASTALWLLLGCSRYSAALSSSSLLFIHVTVALLTEAQHQPSASSLPALRILHCVVE